MANYSEMTSKELRSLCKENGISYSISKDGKKHTMTKDEMINALYDFEENNSEDVQEEDVEQEEVVETVNNSIEISENTSIEATFKCLSSMMVGFI